MTTSPAHSWRYVVTTFQDRAAANPWFVPMRDFVERLAGSPYADSLYPLLSMHTVHLSQHPEVSWDAERLTVDWEDDAFVVRYQGGPRHRSGRSGTRTEWPRSNGSSSTCAGSSSTASRARAPLYDETPMTNPASLAGMKGYVPATNA